MQGASFISLSVGAGVWWKASVPLFLKKKKFIFGCARCSLLSGFFL